MISGYYLTQAISVAANLRLADAIGAVPKNAHELALAVHADESSLYRLLRALSSVGIFKLRRDGRFALAPLGQALRSDDSLSLAPWAIYNGYDFHWRAWGRLLDAVRDGTTGIEQISQKPFFTLLDFDPSAAKVFDSAMGSLARALNGVLVRSYDFSRLRSLVDVGGGTGNLLAAILRRNPRLRGTLYDLPHVVEAAAFNLRKQKLTRRCQVIGGDFFSAVPPGADAYILKQVLHDWSDAQALAILKMIRAAMGERGVL
ncbi:MAG: hypothetical protein GIW99_01055, partial [Candidatus Eremiobacteraeota bacterium]|nr:hypothetical protein [Candidatus Eremiobacteraeota bacterium]